MATGQVFHNLREANEKVTGPAARRLVENAHMFDGPFQELKIIDNACGGGILTRELFALARKHQTSDRSISRVVAADIDERMIDYVEQLAEENNWQQVETLRADQQSMALEGESFTHILSSFGIFFSPDDSKVLSETLRLLRPGGIAGFTSWKYLGWWHDIAVPVLAETFPDAPKLPHPATIFPSKGWNDPDQVHRKMEAAGLKYVQIEELSFTPEAEAAGFAAACAFLVKGMAAKLWPEEVFRRYGEDVLPALERYIRGKCKDGRWDGKMIALIAVGRKG